MKRKILILTAAILALITVFTACSSPKKEETALTLVDETVVKEYKVGDTPDFSGVKAVVSYSDGTAETVTADKLTFSKLDTSSAGKKTLTVTYNKLSTTVEITVNSVSEATLESINIVESSVSKDATVGSAYDISGLQVEAIFSDGTKSLLDKESLEITLPDTETVGEKTLTVIYEGKSDSITVTVSGIKSIQIIADSIVAEVLVGGTLDTSKLKALVTYDNEKTEIITSDKLTVAEFDTSVVGEAAVKVSYKGFDVEYKVNVVGVKSLEINADSVASTVKIFGTLDVSGLKATVTYSNDVVKSVLASELTIGSIDTSSVGAKQLEVSFGDKTAYVSVEVLGVKSITVITSSLKNEILLNRELDTSAAQATVVYTDDSTEIVNASALTFGELDSSSAGEKTVKITYLNRYVDYAVKVCGVEGIRVEGVSKVVVAGGELDLSNMKVYAVYTDSKKSEELLSDGYTTNIEELDFDAEGQKTLVVTYSGELGSFSANVIIDTTEAELAGLEISVYDKVVGLGQVYDKGSVKATAVYGNDSTETITSENLIISDISTDAAGNVTLTVSYTEGAITKEASVTVKVLPITKLTVSGLATAVNVNGTLDTDAMSVTVTFSDGADTLTEVVGIADGVTVSELDTESFGKKSVTVSYLGATVEHTVSVRDLISVTVRPGSYDTVIKEGFMPDTSVLEIEVVYTDGSKEILSADEAGATVKAEASEDGKTLYLSVAYGGLVSKTVSIKVLELVSINALNGSVPSSVVVGQQIDLDALKLTAIYRDENDNQQIYLIDRDGGNLEIIGIDTSVPGEKAIIINYFGQSTTIVVTVKGIESLTVVPGSVQTTVNVEQPFKYENIQFTVNFLDGSYTYVDTTDIYLEIDASGVDTRTAGAYKLYAKYRGVETELVITVVEIWGANNSIFGISSPDSLISRETYKKNFKDQGQIYVVGDDNPYRFYLNVLILDKHNELADVDGKNIKTTAKIYLVEDGTATELWGDALTEMVTVNPDENTYDFTEEAVGKTFKLVVKPAENYKGTASIEHTVKVVDAYNVYDAKELNIMTNVDDDLDGSYTDKHVSQLTAVNNFLAENGIVRPENLAGIVIHDNIDIKNEDIPAEYFYTYTRDGVEKVGFYDHFAVFYHEHTAANREFTMYGNYFSIFSYSLPCVVENGVANNDDAFSSSSLFKFRTTRTLFSTSFDHNNYTGNVVNMAFRDNDPNSNDQSASERHMRGLSCLKPMQQVFNVTNTNIDAFVISMIPEADNLTVNLDKVKFYNAWQGHLFIWNNNYVQEYLDQEKSEPYALYQPIQINITDSLLAKCGGPVILSQSDNRDLTCNKSSGANISVDGKSELYSYVTGQEAWFVAVNQTAMAGQILAMDQLVKGTASGVHGMQASYLTDTKITGVNTVNMIMVNMGTGTTFTTGEDYDGTITIDGTVGLNMTNNPYVDAYVNMTGGVAPIFQSSSGGTCYSDGATGCYAAPGTYADASCFDGEYLTLYYLGMGIMLEYYH